MVAKEDMSEKLKREVVLFTKAPLREYCEHFMRLSTPHGVEGKGAWEGEFDLAYGDNYIKMVRDVKVAIHGYDFYADFVVANYVDEREPSFVIGRSFLVTTRSHVDFGLGDMQIDITMLKEEKNVDTLLANLVEDMVEVGSMSGELVKMG
ncbi:hypothetical protein Tco_0310077 [Tanacetum coccineum]